MAAQKQKMSLEQINQNVNWNEIDQMITDKKCSITKLSEYYNIDSGDLTIAVKAHYGSRIISKRGRNGGIFWSQPEGA